MTCTDHDGGSADRRRDHDLDGVDGHDREQHHHRPAGLFDRVRHAIEQVLGGHSHEPAGSVDKALADADGRRALVISLVVLGLTAVLQVAVVMVSGSVALLGDAVHNIADSLTAVPLFIAFALSRRPASRRFTYGYGRSEDLAGVVIVVVIAASAAFSAYAAIERLIHPRPVANLPAVAAAALLGFAGNEIVARYRISVGRRIGSAALVADGLHARTDGFTSLAVLLGAAGVALGFAGADPIVGLLITVAILGVLRSAAHEVLTRLLDAVDPATVDRAERAIAVVPGVYEVTELRIRWVGRVLRAEASLAVDPDLTLVESHALAHHAEAHLLSQVPHLHAATIHTSPSGSHSGIESPVTAQPA